MLYSISPKCAATFIVVWVRTYEIRRGTILWLSCLIGTFESGLNYWSRSPVMCESGHDDNNMTWPVIILHEIRAFFARWRYFRLKKFYRITIDELASLENTKIVCTATHEFSHRKHSDLESLTFLDSYSGVTFANCVVTVSFFS